jgi:serine/threonine protein kinase
LKTILFPGTDTSPKEMVLSDFKLGEGCYGTVYLGYAKNDPTKIYAIKCIDRSKVKGEKAM